MAKMAFLTDREKEQVKSQAVDFWLKSTNSMAGLFQKVETWERLYRCQLPKDIEADFAEMPDRAALVPSDVYDNIDSNVAAIMNLVFGEKPYFPLQKYGQPAVRDEQVIKAEALCQYMMDVQSDCAGFEYEAELIIKEALCFGVTAAVEVWVDKKVRAPLYDGNGMQMTDQYGYGLWTEQLIDSYSETRGISLLRVRIDPSVDDIRNNRITGFHYLRPLDELIKENQKPNSPYKFDAEQVGKKAGDLNKYYQYVSAEWDKYGSSAQMTSAPYGGKLVEIREIRGLFTVGEGAMQRQMDLVVYLAGEDMLIGCKPNDLPVNSWESFMFPVVNKQKNRKFPMGLIEPIADTFLEKFVKRNQSLDEAGRNTYQMYLADSNAFANQPDIIENEGGKIIKLDLSGSGLNSVHEGFAPLPKTPSPQDTFVQSQSLTQELKVGMRNKKYAENATQPSTATGVSEQVAGDQSDLEQLVRNLKHSFFSPACRLKMIFWNYYRGHAQHEITDFRGQKHLIEPGDMAYYWLCDFETSTAMDHQAMKRRVVEMAPLIWNDPLCDPHAARKTTLTILKYPNLDEVLPPSEYQEMIIERENAALTAGVEQPVSRFDPHQAHNEAHGAWLNQLMNPAVQAQMTPEQLKTAIAFISAHMQEHDGYIQQMSDSLGNTKEMGGNAGNLNQPDAASINKFSGIIGQRR